MYVCVKQTTKKQTEKTSKSDEPCYFRCTSYTVLSQ